MSLPEFIKAKLTENVLKNKNIEIINFAMTNPGTTHMSRRSDLSKKNDRKCFGKNNNNKIDRKHFEKTFFL